MDWDMIDRGTNLLGGIGGGIGAWLGGDASEDERKRAEETLRSIGRLYEGVNPYVSAGHEDAFDLGPSAMEGVASQVDPAMRSAQLQALRGLMDAGANGGMDAQSRAALMQGQAMAAREQRAQQGALRQDFQARGMGGGGLELGLRAAAGQQSANANAMAGVQAAGDARSRALSALQSGAGIAGQVRGADYSQAADRAGARDRVAEYNSRNRQGVAGRNIDRTMDARQQTVNNQFRRADGQAGALSGQVQMSREEAERRRQQGYAVGGALGSAAGAVGGGFLGGW